MKKLIIILLLVSTAGYSFAAFGDGHPLANNTNVSTWHQALSNYNTAVEIWDQFVLTQEIYLNTNLNQEYVLFENVKTPIHYVTTSSVAGDTYGVYSNLNWRFHPISTPVETNYSGFIDFASNDIAGIGFMYFGTNQYEPLHAALLRFIPRFLWLEPSYLTGYDDWVTPDEAFVASYLTRTDTNGNTPDTFPMQSLAGIFSRTTNGYLYEIETNAFGEFVTGHSAGAAYGALFNDRVSQVQESFMPIAELVYTGGLGWVSQTLAAQAELQRMYDSTILPVLTYERHNTNLPYSSVSVTISGDASRYPYEYFTGGQKRRWTTNETVVISGATAPCTFRWEGNITLSASSASSNSGDSISLGYTNIMTIPRYGVWNTISYLYPSFVDNLYYLVDGLRIIKSSNTGWGGGVTSNRLQKSGQSNISWAGAKANADANLTTNTSHEFPCEWTKGSYNGTTWFATYRQVIAEGETQKASSSFEHEFHHWFKAAKPVSYAVYDAHSSGYAEQVWQDGEDSGNTYASDFVNTVATPASLSAPTAVWCADPAGPTNTARGWQAGLSHHLITWTDL